ncbi:MAG: NADH-quinone oxidoreductase subunit NuoK, partial [Bdellovibrio sp.]
MNTDIINNIGLTHYLVLAALLFVMGMAGVLVRRNVLVLLMSIELMLNSVNLTFVAFSKFLGILDGHIMVFFVMS